MSKRAKSSDFTAWADAVLAGTGWTAGTMWAVTEHAHADLATAALADGFAAAARALAGAPDDRRGAA